MKFEVEILNTFKICDIEVGNGNLILMAGPCGIEGYERSLKIGRRAKEIADKLKWSANARTESSIH